METKKTEKKLKITYVKSSIGFNKKQKATLDSLGLRKLNSYNILTDSDSVRGAINKVSHLIKVEEVK